MSIVQIGLPALTVAFRDEFGLGPSGFGVLFAVAGLGSAAALVVAGSAVDRFGPRPTLVVGGAVGAAGLAIAGLARTATEIGIALAVSGAGLAAIPMVGMTEILTRSPPDRRGLLLGARQMAVPAGGLVASLDASRAVPPWRVRPRIPGSGRGNRGDRLRLRRAVRSAGSARAPPPREREPPPPPPADPPHRRLLLDRPCRGTDLHGLAGTRGRVLGSRRRARPHRAHVRFDGRTSRLGPDRGPRPRVPAAGGP